MGGDAKEALGDIPMIDLLLLAVTFFKHQLGSILFEFQTIFRPIVFFSYSWATSKGIINSAFRGFIKPFQTEYTIRMNTYTH
jgi:hypothetical protein